MILNPAVLFRSLLLSALLIGSFCGCNKNDSDSPSSPQTPTPQADPPTIISFFPASGMPGDQTVITGTNFSSSGSTVKFNGTDATVVSASSDQIAVTVPMGATTGKISVSVNGRTAISGLPFIVLNPPAITDFSPTFGRPGDQVVISGSDFNLLAAVNIVKFNGVVATVAYATTTKLTVTVPPGATSGPISVTITGRTSTSSSIFQVYDSQVSTFAGSASGLLDGTGTAARFSYPSAITKDAAGNFYVADVYNRAVRKITPSGVVSTVSVISNIMSAPAGIAVDGAGYIYVSDYYLNIIWKISSAGVVSLLAGTGEGYVDGPGPTAKFKGPSDVAVDANGNVYVADRGNRRIRKITPAGDVSTFAGSDTASARDGIGLSSIFISPAGITIDAAGNLFVSDYGQIRKITQGAMVTTIAGTFNDLGYADGPALSAKFLRLKGLATDASGNLFIADGRRVRKIKADGIVITIAGTGDLGFADGVGSSAKFDGAVGVVVDATGNVFVADDGNNRIRKITF